MGEIEREIKIGRLANKDDYTNDDMTEFRKYMQLTVILAKQISQIEDYDDDVIVLPQIDPPIEENRRLHVFDNA